MGSCCSHSSVVYELPTTIKKVKPVPLLADDLCVFMQFIDEYCSFGETCFVRADLLDSAWISYNHNIMLQRQHRYLTIPLAKRIGYNVEGNIKTPVIIGLRLERWPICENEKNII